MLFVQAMTYTLRNPDDGACELQLSVTDCEAVPSPFNSNDSKCYWDDAGKCHFRSPDSELVVILYVAAFAAIISMPIVILVDWIVMNILARPSICAKTSPFSQQEATLISNVAIKSGSGEGKQGEKWDKNEDESNEGEFENCDNVPVEKVGDKCLEKFSITSKTLNILQRRNGIATKFEHVKREADELTIQIKAHRKRLGSDERKLFDGIHLLLFSSFILLT